MSEKQYNAEATQSMWNAFYQSNWDMVKDAFARNADPNSKNSNNESILHCMIRLDDFSGLRNSALSACVKAGGDINEKDEFGKTMLIVAVSKRLFEKISVLLSLGADPNISHTKTGNTSMHLAQDPQAIYLLVNAKGNLSVRNHAGLTPPQNWQTTTHNYLHRPEYKSERRDVLRHIYDEHFNTLNAEQQAVWRKHFDPTPERRANVELPKNSNVARYLHTLHNVSGRGAA